MPPKRRFFGVEHGFLVRHVGVYRRNGCLSLRGCVNELGAGCGLPLFLGGGPSARIWRACLDENGVAGRKRCAWRRACPCAHRAHYGCLACKRHHRVFHRERRFADYAFFIYFDCICAFRSAFLRAWHMFRRCWHGGGNLHGACAQRRRE